MVLADSEDPDDEVILPKIRACSQVISGSWGEHRIGCGDGYFRRLVGAELRSPRVSSAPTT
jgi:hypothetical protein